VKGHPHSQQSKKPITSAFDILRRGTAMGAVAKITTAKQVTYQRRKMDHLRPRREKNETKNLGRGLSTKWIGAASLGAQE